MDDRKDEKIFDIDGYLGKAPEENADAKEESKIKPEKAGEIGAEAVDVAEKTAVDPVQLKYKRNRIIVALVFAAIVLIAGVFVVIDQIDRGNMDARGRESYKQTLATLAENEKAFKKAFNEYSYSVYGLKKAPQFNEIYPTSEQMEEAERDCLSRFDIDITEQSLLSSRDEDREDYLDVSEDYARISANYVKATGSLDLCRQDIIYPIESAFSIEYGELKIEDRGDSVALSQPSLIGYQGERKIENAVITFSLYDDNGSVIAGTKDAWPHTFDKTVNTSEKLAFDPFVLSSDDSSGVIMRQNISRADVSKYKNSKVGIYSISGSFQVQTDK